MAWVRIDDAFFHHPKLSGLGALRLPAIGLHLLALCWCNTNLTDGKISDTQVRILAGDLTALLPEGQADPVIQALTAAKMWRATKAGYAIHDYLKYQPGKAQVLEERRATAVRVQRHRNAKSNASRNAVTNAPVTTKYNPPVPVPDPGTTTSPTDQQVDPTETVSPLTAAASLKDCKSRFFGAENTGQQVAALIDAAAANGVAFNPQERARLGALVKKYGHGRPAYEAFMASLGEEGPIDYMTRVLGVQDGQRRNAAGYGQAGGLAGKAQGRAGEGAVPQRILTTDEVKQFTAERRAEEQGVQAAGTRRGDGGGQPVPGDVPGPEVPGDPAEQPGDDG